MDILNDIISLSINILDTIKKVLIFIYDKLNNED